MEFASDTKLSGEVDTWEGRANLQEDLHRLKEWANKNLIKFNKDKCHALHMGKQNPGVQHRPGSACLESWDPVDSNFSMHQHVLLWQRKPMGCWAASTRT